MKNFIFNKEVLPGKLRAIKEYGKFVTRRTQGLDEINKEPDSHDMVEMVKTTPEGWQTTGHSYLWTDEVDCGNLIIKPRYQVGERVFIRESLYKWTGLGKPPSDFINGFCYSDNHQLKNYEEGACVYNATPYSMSEKEARYFGTVTSVRLERVQEITLEDIYLEGCPLEKASIFSDPLTGYEIKGQAYEWFGTLWNSLSKPPLMWENNPCVFRYEVEVK